MRRKIVVLCLILCSGCAAAPRGEVEGAVRRDGRALDNVLVTFVPEEGTHGIRAAGVTDSRGRFSLKSEDGKPGVAAGSYRVTVEDLAINDAPRDREGTVLKMPPRRVPAPYASLLQTPLRKAVEAGRQEVTFDLPGGS